MGAEAAEVAERYRVILEGYLARVEAVPDEAWGAPTPCDEWTVRDLVAHSVAVHRRMLSRVDGSEPPDLEPGPARPGEDLPGEIRAVSAAVQRTLDDPAIADLVVETPAGAQRFIDLAGTLLCGDTLIHTWDLARACGQDERLEPGAVEVTLNFMLSREEGAMRQPGRFGARLPEPPDADPQTRLLLFCGRRV